MRALLFVVFVAIPLLELAIIIQVGQLIGVAGTIVSLLAISLVGAALVKHEGLRAVMRLREALAEGRWPGAEVVDGALLLFAGALLLTPGYFTDAVGLLLLLPPSRAVANRALRSRVRLLTGLGPAAPGDAGRSRPGGGRDGVVDVDVVDVRRTGEDDDHDPPSGEIGGR
jgi:UPF0716 protein FxsA